MSYTKLSPAALSFALLAAACTSHLGVPLSADGGAGDSPDGGMVSAGDAGAVVVVEPDGGLNVSTPDAGSSFNIKFGTAVYPGNSIYWDGLCGQFSFQQFSYDTSVAPAGSGGVSIGASFSATMNPNDLAANLLSMPCDPSIVDTVAVHVCLGECSLDVGIFMEWDATDCTTGATLLFPFSQELFIPAQCVANQATPADATLDLPPITGSFAIIAGTNVPPGDGNYPHGICATYTTQTFELDENSQPTALPSTGSATYTDSMNDALLTAAGMSPGEGTVSCNDALPSPKLDSQVTVTASDFVDCATGEPIDALAGKQLTLSQRVDCVGTLNLSPTPVWFNFDLGYPEATNSSPTEERALGYSFELDDNYGAPPGGLCADIQVQATQIAADGTRTPMGAPFLQSSDQSHLPPLVGCIASLPAPAPDWSEEVSVLRLFDCTSGATAPGVASPALQPNDFNCAAESGDDLNLGIAIVPGQP